MSPVGVRGRELGAVPLTGTVSFRVGVVVPDPLPAVRLLGVTRRWIGIRLGVPSSVLSSDNVDPCLLGGLLPCRLCGRLLGRLFGRLPALLPG